MSPELMLALLTTLGPPFAVCTMVQGIGQGNEADGVTLDDNTMRPTCMPCMFLASLRQSAVWPTASRIDRCANLVLPPPDQRGAVQIVVRFSSHLARSSREKHSRTTP